MKESLSQEALVHVGVWCLGEFGDHLVSGKAVGPDNQPIRVTPGRPRAGCFGWLAGTFTNCLHHVASMYYIIPSKSKGLKRRGPCRGDPKSQFRRAIPNNAENPRAEAPSNHNISKLPTPLNFQQLLIFLSSFGIQAYWWRFCAWAFSFSISVRLKVCNPGAVEKSEHIIPKQCMLCR